MWNPNQDSLTLNNDYQTVIQVYNVICVQVDTAKCNIVLTSLACDRVLIPVSWTEYRYWSKFSKCASLPWPPIYYNVPKIIALRMRLHIEHLARTSMIDEFMLHECTYICYFLQAICVKIFRHHMSNAMHGILEDVPPKRVEVISKFMAMCDSWRLPARETRIALNGIRKQLLHDQILGWS